MNEDFKVIATIAAIIVLICVLVGGYSWLAWREDTRFFFECTKTMDAHACIEYKTLLGSK